MPEGPSGAQIDDGRRTGTGAGRCGSAVVVGRGPSLFQGLTNRLELELVGRLELGSGAVALSYRPRAQSGPADAGRREPVEEGVA